MREGERERERKVERKMVIGVGGGRSAGTFSPDRTA
jgi:hypothetical protein